MDRHAHTCWERPRSSPPLSPITSQYSYVIRCASCGHAILPAIEPIAPTTVGDLVHVACADRQARMAYRWRRRCAQVAWREYGLRLPPQYPLRFLDDIAGSDLLGPLAAALAPRGVERTEAQMTLRPAHHWALNWGWRGSAMALKLRLEAKDDYALADDARRIEAKLAATPFELSLRIVAVGAEAAGDRLTAALNEVAHVLGAYSQGTSHQVQSLIQIGAGRAQIRAAAPALVVHNRAPRFAPPPTLL